MVIAQQVIELLSRFKFPLQDEKFLQSAIQLKFDENKIEYKREHRLDSKNIPDFFIDGVAIEIKIKGNAKSIYRQCERYCSFESVNELILITNRSMGFPKEINGKPCYVIKLGVAWL